MREAPPHSGMHARAAALLALLVALAPAPARAQSSRGDEALRTAARAKLEQGARLMDHGDYAQALANFEDAYRLVPSPKIFFNIGVANVGLARYPAALLAFEEFLAKAEGASPKTIGEARVQIANLRSKVASVRIACARDGVEIVLDGQSHGKTPLERELYVDPGSHRVLAQADGEPPTVVPFTVVAGEQRSLVVELAKRPPPTPLVNLTPSPQERPKQADVTVAVPVEPEPAPPVYRRGWFWAGVGGAVLIAAGAVVFASRTRDPMPSHGSFSGD